MKVDGFNVPLDTKIELPSWIKCDMKMFANDTKLWCRIKTDADSVVLQAYLDSLQSWSDTWQLKFNADKCKVTHIEHSFQTKYYMGEDSAKKELEWVHHERDLGVISNNNNNNNNKQICIAP